MSSRSLLPRASVLAGSISFFSASLLAGGALAQVRDDDALHITSVEFGGWAETVAALQADLHAEGTSVHVQADVYDNLVLGSTPTGMDLSGIYTDTNPPPLGAFSEGQDPATQGINSDRDAIRIKRAWAEVEVDDGVSAHGRCSVQNWSC